LWTADSASQLDKTVCMWTAPVGVRLER